MLIWPAIFSGNKAQNQMFDRQAIYIFLQHSWTYLRYVAFFKVKILYRYKMLWT